MKAHLKTSKVVYFYQHVNERGFCEIRAKVELPGWGHTVDDCFQAWKQFMSACGYVGMEKYELEETTDEHST